VVKAESLTVTDLVCAPVRERDRWVRYELYIRPPIYYGVSGVIRSHSVYYKGHSLPSSVCAERFC
jgi:hypothetical protein